MKMIKRILVTVLLLAIVVNIGLYFWSSNGYKAMDITQSYLKSSLTVEVENHQDWIAFTPKDKRSKIGIVFYPGGNVESESYSPLAYELAEKGVSVYILHVPYKLAILNPYKAKDIIDSESSLKWYVGGHSLGGVVSSLYYERYPQSLEGLFFLASYPMKNMSNSDIPVLSIQGSKDGLMGVDEFDEKKKLFPQNTTFIEVKGGNHSQFGYYGLQDKDQITDLSREEQQRVIVEALSRFIE